MPYKSEHASRPLIWGHRGASDVAPENTLAAFRASVRAGADGIELDVMRCGSGEIVVIHDDTVDRTTNSSGHVGTMSFGTLRMLDAGALFAPDYAGEAIPTLEEVLDAVGHRVRVNIEIKSPERHGAYVETDVVAMVRSRALQDQVIVSSFDPRVLARLKKVDPDMPRALLYDRHGPLVRAPIGGVLLAQPQALHPHWSLVDRSMVQWAHRHDYQVNVWTVDDPQVARQLAEWGVDGIITDHPAALLEALA
jgi:glycerophosphoryl diester phosphodiesterase